MSKFMSFRSTDNDSDFSTRRESTPESSIFQRSASAIGRVEGQERLRNAARIPLDQIEADAQVRTEFDEDGLRNLGESIKAQGQLQPALVRWDEARGKYIIIAGERRFRACRMVGIDKLDCVIREGEFSEDKNREVQLLENLQREDLTPIEEGRTYQKLLDDRGCSIRQLAEDLHVPRATIQRAVKLLSLPDDIQQMVNDGQLPKSLFREILKLKTEEEQRQVIDAYLDGGTFDTVAEEVAEKSGTRKAAPKKTTKRFTANGITLQATGKGRMTNADVAAVMQEWLRELKKDGRVKLGRAA